MSFRPQNLVLILWQIDYNVPKSNGMDTAKNFFFLHISLKHLDLHTQHAENEARLRNPFLNFNTLFCFSFKNICS